MDSFVSTQIDELSALLALSRKGSFVGAGRLINKHASVISKRIVALEERLGVRLVERTTRQVKLTEAGEKLASEVLAAQQLIADAEQAASEGAAEPKGRLRLALPAAMGRKWIAPLLPDFLLSYPQVELDVHFGEQFLDLIDNRIDVAVRIGALSDSQLIAKKLADHERILCAAPSYIARHGNPNAPAELGSHNCLQFNGFATFPEWHLFNGDRREVVHARGVMTSNDSPALTEVAKAGLGILGAGEWLVAEEMARGELVRVLPDWRFDQESGIYLLRPSKLYAPAHVAAFCNWITAMFRGAPPWRKFTIKA
ncbi:LysR family transcriptional regulator [Rhizobium sp. ZPR3]|uniref:LysR family transcriptional regulator n=2 Tax=unclassified Rhizobium TaxID=2613769 RepID=A0AAU7SQS0_9HYPH